MKPIKPKKVKKLDKGIYKELPEEKMQGFKQEGFEDVMGKPASYQSYRPVPRPAKSLRDIKPATMHPVLVGKTPTTVEKFSKKKGK